MAKTKGKTMNEVTEREVDFGELELKIAKPSLNMDKTMVVTGNFAELGTNIKALVDKYKGTQLTEDNVSYIKTLKGHFTSLRTGIERERKEWKKVYITPASKLIDSMCDELQKIVAEGEDALGSQLDAYDEKRKEELTIILKEYVEESVAKHNLREEYASQIQLLDKYYNKTQEEEDSADDIERQAVELEKKQKEYDSGVALIKAECEDAGFLPDTYIRELNYKSAMEIILEVKADKKKAKEMQDKIDSGEKVVVGKSVDDELKNALDASNGFEDEEDKYRERILRVRYLASQAKLMGRFFKENNIQFEFIEK
jgi:hypothetical protein